MALTSKQVEAVFNQAFAPYNTRLIGGADEPLYQPADKNCPQHRLYYREDFVASALHEIAHWCIAGEARRQQVDFGYWYQPDGRTVLQQRAFEQVEVKPQALEWLLSAACGRRFNISADNLSSTEAEARGASPDFVEAVADQARQYCRGGLPPRGEQCIRALMCASNVDAVFNPALYRVERLS